MKKLIAFLTVFFAFTLSANSQNRDSLTSAEEAKRDFNEMNQLLTLTEDQKNTFSGLFINKQEILSDTELSEERKRVFSEYVSATIKSNLNEEQLKTLENNKELMMRLTH